MSPAFAFYLFVFFLAHRLLAEFSGKLLVAGGPLRTTIRPHSR